MSVKDIAMYQIDPVVAFVGSTSCDNVEYSPGFVQLLNAYGGTDIVEVHGDGTTAIHKFIVSPAGVAYPGDAVAGNGSKRVKFLFSTGAVVTMTQVDNLDLARGWAIVTKGEHFIAYLPRIINRITVDATP